MKRSWKSLFVPAFVMALLLFPENGLPCWPSFPEAIFTYETHPGKPLKWYAEGNMGIILPSFARSYLVVAYRYLSERPLSASETKDAVRYWRWALSGPWIDSKGPDKAVKEWLAARERVTAQGQDQAEISPFKHFPPPVYGSYANCLPDAFHTAVLTLQDRAHRFGAGDGYVREWVQAQDQVFSNCDEGRSFPARPAEDSPAWFKADRRYQMAAADLYMQNFDVAIKEFDQIAQDSGSPWRTIAPYLAARTVVRKATLNAINFDNPTLIEAEGRVQKILNDSSLKAVHPPAHKLMAFLAFRLHPKERLQQLARLLSGTRPDPNFYQDMIDYTWSLNRLRGDRPVFFEGVKDDTPAFDKKMAQWEKEQYEETNSERAAYELTDWVLTFQQTGEPGRTQAIHRWRKQQNLLWLVAAISKVDAHDPVTPELLQAAEQAPPGSPAYLTVTYHRIRLMKEAGEYEKARELLDRVILPLEQKISSSSWNLFLTQRMQLAGSFEDFMKYVAHPVIDDDNSSGMGPEEGYMEEKEVNELLAGKPIPEDSQHRFDHSAANALNIHVPVELLARVALSAQLPEPLRGEVAASAWTRAIMLGRYDIADKLAPEVARDYPVTRKLVEDYLQAGSPKQKRDSGLFLILHFPGLRPYVNAGEARRELLEKIDNFRDNWWCLDSGASLEQMNFEHQNDRESSKKRKAPPGPTFLSEEDARNAHSQWQQLVKGGTGPDYLARETLKWASEEPSDSRIAEALHLAVRSTRYGCDDRETAKLSHQVFKLLHSRYSASKWAKETPYWFGGTNY